MTEPPSSATAQNRRMEPSRGAQRAGGGSLEVTAVCVTWNSSRDIPGLLDSLEVGLADLSWQLVVVDNASTDGTAELVRALAPAAVVVETGHNRGYAAGVNRGIDEAPPGSAVLVLNPDVRLDGGCGRRLVQALARPDTDIAVPVQRDAGGVVQPTLRRRPSVLRALGEAVLGGVRAGRVPLLGEMVTSPPAYSARTRADWATGSVMAISRACLDAVGAWDEDFFLYSEETEYALRAGDLGFTLRLAPAATCVHRGGASHTDPRLWTLLMVNRVRLFASRHGAVRTLAFRVALTVGEALRSGRGAATHRHAMAALLRGDDGIASSLRPERRLTDHLPAAA